ncbi:hypothetical protein LXL04_012980 [Taraxacum kok-saghyz]
MNIMHFRQNRFSTSPIPHLCYLDLQLSTLYPLRMALLLRKLCLRSKLGLQSSPEKLEFWWTDHPPPPSHRPRLAYSDHLGSNLDTQLR